MPGELLTMGILKLVSNTFLLVILAVFLVVPTGIVLGLRPQIKTSVLGAQTVKSDLFQRTFLNDDQNVWIKTFEKDNQTLDFIIYKGASNQNQRYPLYEIENTTAKPFEIVFRSPDKIFGPFIKQKIYLNRCMTDKPCQSFLIYNLVDEQKAASELTFPSEAGEKLKFELLVEIYGQTDPASFNISFELPFQIVTRE